VEKAAEENNQQFIVAAFLTVTDTQMAKGFALLVPE
jgi:hypothetical protein